MIEDFDQTIRTLVKSDYRMADVFKKHQINFCCAGNISLAETCRVKNIDYDIMVSELKGATYDFRISSSTDFNLWKIDFLVDFIINVHHQYLYQVVPDLSGSLKSFSLGHHQKYPEIVQIEELFDKLSKTLLIQSRHEDEVIFPYIKQIDSAHRRKEAYGNLFVRTLRKPLSIVGRDREQINTLLEELENISGHFTVSGGSCISYTVILQRLKEFSENAKQHQYLEHNILFSRALSIEQTLLQT
jgi:regulator of cell morphogenesis and NO signaling